MTNHQKFLNLKYNNPIQETGFKVNQFIYYAIDNQWQVSTCTSSLTLVLIILMFKQS